MTARHVATRVLYRVAEDGAWASRALDAELSRAGLSVQDAGLATEIVYGSLRALPALDAAVDKYLKRPKKTEPWLRAALRVGAYQLLFLSRVPPHAAVSETVSVVRHDRGPRLGGVANAVLRKVAAERPAEPAPPTRLLAPRWIERAIVEGLGPERAEAFLASGGAPPTGLRATRGGRDALVERLREARPGARFEPSAIAPSGILAYGAGDPRELPGFEEGAFAVQEIGSQAVAERVGVEPGMRVADLCCGHGTKTLALAEAVGDEGRVEAVDLYEEKLEQLSAERARLGVAPERVGARAVDLTVGLGGLEERSFDRVLLDAPCTGLGTLRRRPELALRLTPQDPARLAELQGILTRAAARLVRPGGRLVVATCSGTRPEGEGLREALEGEGRAVSYEAIGPWQGEPIDVYQVLIGE